MKRNIGLIATFFAVLLLALFGVNRYNNEQKAKNAIHPIAPVETIDEETVEEKQFPPEYFVGKHYFINEDHGTSLLIEDDVVTLCVLWSECGYTLYYEHMYGDVYQTTTSPLSCPSNECLHTQDEIDSWSDKKFKLAYYDGEVNFNDVVYREVTLDEYNEILNTNAKRAY